MSLTKMESSSAFFGLEGLKARAGEEGAEEDPAKCERILCRGPSGIPSRSKSPSFRVERISTSISSLSSTGKYLESFRCSKSLASSCSGDDSIADCFFFTSAESHESVVQIEV